jgi:tetratricopeptide (TPR) repeat protein
VKPGRNDACPCGSGKKYKACCGRIALPVDLGELRALSNAGRYRELEGNARELIAQHPDSGPIWEALAVSLLMQGKDALQALQRAASLMPNDAEAHKNLGNARRELGRFDEAVASYRRALDIQPDSAEAHNNLGGALRALGQLEQALLSFRRALRLNPGYAEAHNNLGNALMDLGQPEEALACYRRALEIAPGYARVHGNLGDACLILGRLDEATASYRRALALSPDYVEAHNNLGNALRGLGQLEDAEASYRRALMLRPEFVEAHNHLGAVLRLQGRSTEAQASCRSALEINPNCTAALVLLADLSADGGQFAEAEELFKRAIAIEPDLAQAWAGIARLRRMTREDAAWLAQAQRLAGIARSPRQEVYLRYAIGKYLDDVGDFEQAFDSYRRANELTKQYQARFDRQNLTRAVDQIIHAHEPRRPSPTPIAAIASARPVFIVGMPRSGTSLAEQILASHPKLFGAGELTFWKAAAAGYQASASDEHSSANLLRKLAEDYLRLLQDLSADALRVTDKMPANFLFLGLIHAALPNARIIHMQRNPIDTCLSLYFQHFESAHPYANDLEDLAYYYAQYLRLMRHWRAALPRQVMLDVPYERLVNEPEAWSRRMLDFIGLPWHSRCADFHQTARNVTTASKWQVRQRINRSSVDRWRNYEKFIGPLQKLAPWDPRHDRPPQ